MPKYTNITKVGDTRTRCRYIGIRFPVQGSPTIEILEQQVVLASLDGKVAEEHILTDLGAIQFAEELSLTETFPKRLKSTDAMILGQTATLEQILDLLYSFVRSKQVARDIAPPPPLV